MAKSKYFSDEPEAPPAPPPAPEPVAEAAPAKASILAGANAPGKVPPSLKGTHLDPNNKKPEAAKKKGG